jgi:hypothetical protein
MKTPPQREIISPLKASRDHLWAPFFIVYPRWVRVRLFGKLSRGGEQQLKITLMAIGSQGNN